MRLESDTNLIYCSTLKIDILDREQACSFQKFICATLSRLIFTSNPLGACSKTEINWLRMRWERNCELNVQGPGWFPPIPSQLIDWFPVLQEGSFFSSLKTGFLFCFKSIVHSMSPLSLGFLKTFPCHTALREQKTLDCRRSNLCIARTKLSVCRKLDTTKEKICSVFSLAKPMLFINKV